MTVIARKTYHVSVKPFPSWTKRATEFSVRRARHQVVNERHIAGRHVLSISAHFAFANLTAAGSAVEERIDP